MDRTTYNVIVDGYATETNYRSETRAVADAKKAGGFVRMTVGSGTYKSRTIVWPELGQTYSN